MMPPPPSPRLIVALARIRVLRARAAHVEQLLLAGHTVPQELELDDRDMLELERDLIELVREHHASQMSPGAWHPFWHAAYEHWSPADGVKRFWSALRQQLGETERVLSELLGPRSVFKMHTGPMGELLVTTAAARALEVQASTTSA